MHDVYSWPWILVLCSDLAVAAMCSCVPQVVHYVQLDRVVAAAARSRQAEQPKGTTTADRPACSTHHPSSCVTAHAEAGHAAAGDPLGGALRAAEAARPAMQQQDSQQMLAGGAGSTAQAPAAAGSSRRSSSSSVGSMPDLDELVSSCWDEATSLAGGDKQADPSCPAAQQQQQEPHLHQYSVVWHEIYQVPVLYLGGCHAGAGG